ncbi:hypothetical protein [Catellatospora sp. TT07R-123]|uniref:hypothetical protein n=1 Tax=Catellatospora sp. TT07R-123 TaxID=2733863 RepID=UPI001BB417CB|nr:hypothetical protein [Catellatospora sp. TT07R-123]
MTWVVVAAGIAHLAVIAYWMLVTARSIEFYESWDGTVSGLDRARFFDAFDTTTSSSEMVVAVGLVFVFAFAGWHFAVRKTLESVRVPASDVLTHWGFIVWRAGAIALLLLAFSRLNSPGIDTQDLAALRTAILDEKHGQEFYVWIRAAIGVLLLVAVIAIHRRVRVVLAAHTA